MSACSDKLYVFEMKMYFFCMNLLDDVPDSASGNDVSHCLVNLSYFSKLMFL